LGGVSANIMDAAVGRSTHPAAVTPGVIGIGPISGVGAPSHGDLVAKVGWRTGYTFGTYSYDMDYTTSFGGTPALFNEQMGIVGAGQATRFAQQGDSGAPVLLAASNEIVGMVIGVASGMDLTFASPIVPVFTRFGVRPA